jgi:hypothetical protein
VIIRLRKSNFSTIVGLLFSHVVGLCSAHFFIFSADFSPSDPVHIQAIRHCLGREPEGAELAVKNVDYDIGVYYEVVCYYNEGDETAADYAFRCERKAPRTWAEGGVRPPPRVRQARKTR